MCSQAKKSGKKPFGLQKASPRIWESDKISGSHAMLFKAVAGLSGLELVAEIHLIQIDAWLLVAGFGLIEKALARN